MDTYCKPSRSYKVFIRCNTYNHENFINDALRGFASQETTFPYCALVVDDCSKDKTREKIINYVQDECFLVESRHSQLDMLDSYVYKHKKNPNCTFFLYLFTENYWQNGKNFFGFYQPFRECCDYEALCEGDDYWIDPLKIEKQVSFLDRHLDYGLIHTDFNLTKGKRNHKNNTYKEDGNYFPYILEVNGIEVGTLTALYRLSVFNKLPHKYLEKKWPMWDKPLWIELAHETKIHYIKDITACYRILSDSASHGQDINKMIKFKDIGIEITEYYSLYYNALLTSNLRNLNYYQSILRYACRLNNLEIAEKYYTEGKLEKKISYKAFLFYFATKHPILKNIIETFIKV